MAILPGHYEAEGPGPLCEGVMQTGLGHGVNPGFQGVSHMCVPNVDNTGWSYHSMSLEPSNPACWLMPVYPYILSFFADMPERLKYKFWVL